MKPASAIYTSHMKSQNSYNHTIHKHMERYVYSISNNPKPMLTLSTPTQHKQR